MTRSIRVFSYVLRGYRKFISPLIGSHCRFYPSCSVYAEEAIRVHGPFRGLWLGFKRVFRCHPGHPGGLDAVPPAVKTCTQERASWKKG